MQKTEGGTHVVIIGNGIAGITCARHLRKRNSCRITVISAETPHFFSRTALMYIYMGHMKYEHTKPYEDGFWAKNRIELIYKYVASVHPESHTLQFADGTTMTYDKLVIAAGSKPNKFGWPGQDLKGVQGLYSYPDLQLMEENTRSGVSHAVIVGGGLIGVEMAEMLHARGIGVTFLVREENFWGTILPREEAELVNRQIRKQGIDLRLATGMKEIIADSTGRASVVITDAGEKIACQFVGLTAGVSPNTGFLEHSGIRCERGVIINPFFETSAPDVYAIGDCAQFAEALPGRRNVEQVWYTGRMHGETLALTLSGKRTAYNPGHWFNAAKFFDIEYQTYGLVGNKLKPNEAQFYWEHANGEICIKFVFDKTTMQLAGMNVFGIRIRHDVADAWLRAGKTIQHVVQHLRDANFDPEFYTKHEPAIIAAFNNQFNAELQLQPKSWKRILNIS
jgi:NAD(P)H-nitrite reductase large subunit